MSSKRINIDPTFWGPKAWFFIDSIVLSYPNKPKPEEQQIYRNFILSLDMPKDEYIRRMRQQHVWGGGIEIQAACNIWNIRILINNKTSGNNTIIEFLPINNTYNHTIELIWTGAHYEPKKNF